MGDGHKQPKAIKAKEDLDIINARLEAGDFPPGRYKEYHEGATHYLEEIRRDYARGRLSEFIRDEVDDALSSCDVEARQGL